MPSRPTPRHVRAWRVPQRMQRLLPMHRRLLLLFLLLLLLLARAASSAWRNRRTRRQQPGAPCCWWQRRVRQLAQRSQLPALQPQLMTACLLLRVRAPPLQEQPHPQPHWQRRLELRRVLQMHENQLKRSVLQQQQKLPRPLPG